MIKSFIKEFKISTLQERLSMLLFVVITFLWGLALTIAIIEFFYWLGILITPTEEIQTLVNQYVTEFFFGTGE